MVANGGASVVLEVSEAVGGGKAGMASADKILRQGSAFQAAANEFFETARHISLSFVDVTYTVKVGRGKGKSEKAILDQVSGYVKSGSFVAILGPTGSGKTSLLNVLAGRVAKGSHVEGQILVNGRPRDDSFRRISAYVLQDDLLFATLTVWETLSTAAMLRLPSSIPRRKKLEMAELIIRELGLSKARDTRIGNAMIRGVSGGERKRTNIAIEMLSSPSLIFLDEPTSGLDSFQALNVVQSLSELAKSGRTVVCTIHQPRSSIFALFENLLLLSEGRMVYFGAASEAIFYFNRKGFSCPERFNPADYFMDLISIDRRDEEVEEESTKRVRSLLEGLELTSEVKPHVHRTQSQQRLLQEEEESVESHDTRLHGTKETGEEGEGEADLLSSPMYASDWWTQISVLTVRAWQQVTRDTLPLFIAFFQNIVMTIVISVLYSDVGHSQTSIQDKQGAIFFIVVSLAFSGMFAAITTFPLEKVIVDRERASYSYRISAYYPGKVTCEWLFQMLPVMLFMVVTYWPIGFQRTVAKFLLALLVVLLEFSAMNAAGFFIGSLAPTPQTATAMGPLLTVIFMLFGGFYINLSTIPVWIRWIRFLSPIQWAFIGLSVNEFSGDTFTCDPSSPSCISSGEQVLQMLSLSSYTVASAIGYQCCVIVGFHSVAYLTLLLNGPKLQPISQLASRNEKP